MSDVTQLLSKIERGDGSASQDLLPLVYDELRKLAMYRLAQEIPGHTLQATALVHEAYIRLVGSAESQSWNSRGHFFAAAAEAMRRILVESARRKGRQIHGGGMQRHDLAQIGEVSTAAKSDEALLVDAALERLEAVNSTAAKLVKFRYFAGFSNHEAAEMLGISPRKATQIWTYARSWLLADIEKQR